MNTASLHELATTRCWNIAPEAFNFYKNRILSNIEMRVQVEDSRKNPMHLFKMDATSPTENTDFVGNALRIVNYNEVESTDTIINVLHIDGPITRNDGPCNYGSLSMRNQLIAAANVPQVIGHIIILNTPGGSSSALRDFQLAFDYIRSKNQTIEALIDGECASMGTGIATHCDKIHFVNPDDEIGSIGTYGACFTSKDGDENSITKETFREFYADRSKDKNAWYRAAAEGDLGPLAELVNECNDGFIDAILKARPSVTEEQLTGKMYKCGEVVGTLTDGQSTLIDVARNIISEKKPATNQTSTGNSAELENTSQQEPITHNSTKIITMNAYPLLFAALGVEELAIDNEQGAYLNETLLQAMEESLRSRDELLASKDQLITSKDEEIAGLQASLATAESLVESKDQEISGLNTTIENQNTRIAELDSEIIELSNNAGAQVDGGANPDNNNAHPTISMESAPAYDSSLSPMENKRRMDEYEASIKK